VAIFFPANPFNNSYNYNYERKVYYSGKYSYILAEITKSQRQLWRAWELTQSIVIIFREIRILRDKKGKQKNYCGRKNVSLSLTRVFGLLPKYSSERLTDYFSL